MLSIVLQAKDEYRQLKHICWLRNQIVHSTGYVECTQSDLDWLKGFHNRLLTQQDLLAKAHRVIKESQIQRQQQQAKPLRRLRRSMALTYWVHQEDLANLGF